MNATKATMNVCCFRTFGLIAGWVALLLPFQAYALSLGGFQVESALDEPLRAEIQLQSVDAGTLESLEVELATPEDFRRADVPRSEYLKQLQFEVSERAGGNAVVVVTSEQPMREPFLHFLVSVEWGGGKMIREYTGLLDPPVYAGDSPTRVESPAIESSRTAQGDEPAAVQAPEPAATDTVSSITPSTGTDGGRSAEYGPTQEGDTLWQIASRLDTGAVQADIFQIMIALQRQNPDAFIDNNVNRLRTGAILRLDDIAAVADMPAEQASAAYTAQLEEWESFRTRVASASGETAEPSDTATSVAAADESTDTGADTASSTDQAAADTGAAPDTAAAAESAEGQDDVLRIVQATVDEAEQSETASAGSDRSGEIAELQSQVATLQESLESRNLENEELQERVRLLESQLENAQRLIEIESQELAVAQQQAARARQEAELARAQAAEAQEQVAGAGSESGAQQAAAESVQPVEEAGPEAAESSSVMDESESVADSSVETEVQGAGSETQASESSNVQESESGQQASAAGPTAGQSGQSGESTQRVRTSRTPQGSWLSQIPDMLFSSWMWMVGAALGVLVLVLGLLMFLRRRQSIAEFEESILSGSALDSYSETTDSAATSASDTSFLSDFGTAGMGTMQADEVDPLAEAEVYLAYGRDEQAEEVLKEAARRDPERSEVKLKLLEIYKQRNDVKSFETIAEELYPAGDSGDRSVWNQVTAMGRELSPGNPLFQEAAAAAPANEAGGEAPPAAPRFEPSEATAAADEPAGSVDLDLDEMRPASEPAAPAAASASSERAGNDLDFDLEPGMATEPETRSSAPPASTRRDESTPEFGEEFLERPAGSTDPATQPFPAPDQQTDLDRELERLAGEREASTTPSAADTGTISDDDMPAPTEEPAWEKAEADSGTLDFPPSDNADIDFDLNLDDTSVQRLSGGDAARETEIRPAADDNDQLSVSDGDGDEDALLEFESENIPPEETWAGPSSDAAPARDDDSVSYSPTEDVRSAAAPQYNEAETKLDLARAYLDMGDKVGARSIIDEVMREGDPSQRDQAAELASQL